MPDPTPGAMIDVSKLSKTYRVHKRPSGFAAAVRSLFRRSYEPVKALDEVSFAIAAGERVGFLGPNGAGKTTTLKILSGLLYPTSGAAQVAGFNPSQRSPAFLRTITLVMGQKQQLLWDLPPAETFAMNRALYDLPRAEAEQTQRELTELLEIGPLITKPTRQLSLGERMKCELVAALLHRPKVLFLDEPTIGLDVAMQARMRQFIREYNERHGATVILTSHYMEDVAALCPRIVVIDKGHLVYDGDLRGLARRIRPEKRITLRLGAPADGDLVARVGAGKLVKRTDTEVVLAVSAERLNEALRELLAALPGTDLSVEDPPLEEVMREVFQQGRQAAATTPAPTAAAAPPAGATPP
jgi:ABC-2 type transport system ATP-binding protein